MIGAFRRFWNSCVKRQPFLTIALTNGTMGATGDILAQYAFPDPGSRPSSTTTKHAAYSPWRTIRFFAYGCMFGPVAFKWYSFLGRRFPFPKTSTVVQQPTSHRSADSVAKQKAIIKRVSIDQIAFAPVAIAAFFTVMGAMEGKSASEIRNSLCDRYPKALVGNYMLWPWSQLINFGLVPLVYQVPFASMVSVFWNMYLSWVNHKREVRKISD